MRRHLHQVRRHPDGVIDLGAVRDELDELAHRRRLFGFSDSEAKRLRDLCQRERDLLATPGALID